MVSFHLTPREDAVLLLSGPAASTARLFNLTTGRAIWEAPLLSPENARLTVPVHLGTDATFTSDAVLVLSDGQRITKLDLLTGHIRWSTDSPVGSTILYKQLLVSDDTLHILAITSGIAASQLTSFSVRLDAPIPRSDLVQIPSIISDPSDAHLAASSTPGSASLVWSEHGRVRVASVSRDGVVGRTKDLLPGGGRKYTGIETASRRREGSSWAAERTGVWT